MPDLDDYLRNELRRAVRPVDFDDISSKIDGRRTRRARVRRVQAVALAVIVIAGTVGGVVVLSTVFRKGPTAAVGDASPFPIVPKVNGVIVATQQARGGPLQLVSVSPNGSHRQIVETRIEGDPRLPAWSPDGTKLAVAVFPSDAPRAIWVVDADGTNAAKIAEGDNVSRPSWSPDGGEIVFAVDTKQGSSIHIMNADGTGDRVIGASTQGEDYFSVSFSPDGTQLLFDRGTDSGFGIFVMDVDGSDVRRISAGTSDYDPSWSPDGTKIVFTRQEQGAESDIYVMRADGTNVSRLTNDGPGVTNLYPEWSPDGNEIAYVAGVSGGPGSVVVMNRDGGHPVIILNDGVLGISWQPLPTGSAAPSAEQGPGLGFPVCNVSRVTGTFGSARTQGTAYVATKMGDGTGCPAVDGAFNVIAIDLDGDGLADTDYGPIECELECQAFAAPDLNGDGISELLVVQRGGSELALGLFAMVSNFGPAGVGPVPVEIAAPGDPGYGFRPGRPARLLLGGDAGNAERLICEGATSRILLIQSLGSMVPFDSPDAVWKVHEITFTLEIDGKLHVFNTRDYETPTGSPPFDTAADESSAFPCVGA
jgi:TolB protein